MKSKLLLALVIAAAPAMAAPAQTLKPLSTDKAISLALEHTMFSSGASDISTNGITFRFDKVLAPMSNGNYWTWNVGASFAKGEEDRGANGWGNNRTTDIDTMDIFAGVDANFTVAPRTTIFVGPRMGYSTYDVDGANDKTQGLMYGINVGVRYKLQNYDANVEVGFRHSWYERSKAEEGNTEANSIYAGISIGF